MPDKPAVPEWLTNWAVLHGLKVEAHRRDYPLDTTWYFRFTPLHPPLYIRWGTQKLDLYTSRTLDEIKEKCAQQWPELFS